MPENARVAAYAAAGSILAATLAYVFSPSIWPDVAGGAGSRGRRGVVGIRNPGNDCFINSVLQLLAASESLRVFLQSQHGLRLQLELPVESTAWTGTAEKQASKQRRLREGWVSTALLETLDLLNQRRGSQRNISNASFVRCLEAAFSTRISRRQQDAQEFLQIVAERLLDEQVALEKFVSGADSDKKDQDEKHTAEHEQVDEDEFKGFSPSPPPTDSSHDTGSDARSSSQSTPSSSSHDHNLDDGQQPKDKVRAPFEGVLESQVECLECHFRPKPTTSTFVCLTLHVPQQKSTTLDQCLDGLLKQEVIDDYICDRCRLEHAIVLNEKALSATTNSKQRRELESRRSLLEQTLATDPETIPDGLTMPESKLAPKRKITKHTRISKFPLMLAIHLSRSIFDPGSFSLKNTAAVTFPESLRLGGFDRHDYALACLITHSGGHNSGHYETFRKQADPPPSSAAADDKEGNSSPPKPPKKKARHAKRWWRISDDRIGSAHVNEMLGMKREAYIMLYELQQPHAVSAGKPDTEKTAEEQSDENHANGNGEIGHRDVTTEEEEQESEEE